MTTSMSMLFLCGSVLLILQALGQCPGKVLLILQGCVLLRGNKMCPLLSVHWCPPSNSWKRPPNIARLRPFLCPSLPPTVSLVIPASLQHTPFCILHHKDLFSCMTRTLTIFNCKQCVVLPHCKVHVLLSMFFCLAKFINSNIIPSPLSYYLQFNRQWTMALHACCPF